MRIELSEGNAIVHELQNLLLERKKLIHDMEIKLTKQQIRKDGDVCSQDRAIRQLEMQLCAVQQQADNDLLQKDYIIRSLKVQMANEIQRAKHHRKSDAAIIEKQACKIRVLTNIQQSRRYEKRNSRQHGNGKVVPTDGSRYQTTSCELIADVN
jgi:hypothetical protein